MVRHNTSTKMRHRSELNLSLELGLFFLVVTCTTCSQNGVLKKDLCRWMNGRNYYVDNGESGLIIAENVTGVVIKKDFLPDPKRCRVELMTCPSCHLEISFEIINLPTCSDGKWCRCDYLRIKDMVNYTASNQYCGSNNSTLTDVKFVSRTKMVSIDFLYRESYTVAFLLKYESKKNIYIYKGNHNSSKDGFTGTIESVFFPQEYPGDYSAEYILQNEDPRGRVKLVFTDFQLSLWSYVEMFDSNHSRIVSYNGNTFRPPVLISSESKLIVKFDANDEEPRAGFKAEYTFVSAQDWIRSPITDCGGTVSNFGGGITMMNVIPNHVETEFDCVWLIKPELEKKSIIDRLSIRVAQFENMGINSVLIIREGLNSEARLLQSLTANSDNNDSRGEEFTISAHDGVYVRFVGYFTNKSQLAIIYTLFRFSDCTSREYFKCRNLRCISIELKCDGFNHCGDGSDETSCSDENATVSPEDYKWWRTLTTNYYFPKTDSKTGRNSMIVLITFSGVGIFIFLTIVALIKMHRNRERRNNNIRREVLHTISRELDIENSNLPADSSDLPDYDPPPSYEDAVKQLPPPPSYSSINVITNPTAIENRGQRNSAGKISAHQRMSQELPNPLLVSISDEDVSDLRSDASTRNDTDVVSVTCMKSKQTPKLIKDRSKHKSDGKMKKSKSSLKEISDDGKKSGEVVSPCECMGACSCKLVRENKNPKSKNDSSANNDDNSKKIVKRKKRRDNQKTVDFITQVSDITPTTSVNNTEIEKKSKSAGPSSPESNTEFGTKKMQENVEKHSHLRASSGPSEFSLPDAENMKASAEISQSNQALISGDLLMY